MMRLAAEKQPEQDDHRNRHTQQPKQKSASHYRLHINLKDMENVKAVLLFRQRYLMLCRGLPMSGIGH